MQIFEVFQNPNSQYSKVNQPSSVSYSGIAAPGVKQAPTTTATATTTAAAPTTVVDAGGTNLKKGFWSSLGDYAKRSARNYMSSKTGLPADVFKNEKERKEEEAEAERREIEAAIKSKLAAQRKKAATNAALGITSDPEPEDKSTTPEPKDKSTTPATKASVNYNIPAYMRKGIAAPTTTPKAPATKASVNYNIPAYMRKGIAAPTTTPKTTTTAAKPVATTNAIKTAPGQTIPTAPSAKPYQVPGALTSLSQTTAAKAAPTTSAGANAMSSTATQLTNRPTKSSTGGTVTKTPTGLVHTAKQPVLPPAAKPQYKGRQTKVSATPPSGAPTSAEYANLEKRLQQAMAAQGQTQ